MSSIEFHRSMLADRVRNEAFYEALKRLIVPGKSTVADIGSGTGLLGFMASRLGAKQVFMYEQGDIIEMSRKLARHNRIRNCHFFHGHSTEVFEPERCDIVISETLGNFAYEENIIETLADARRFLKPGGAMVPRRIEQFVAPVGAERLHRELTVWDEVGFDLDFAPARAASLNNMYVRTIAPEELAPGMPARRWDQVDLTRKNGSVRHGEAQWEFTAPLTVYGFALWWECELIPGVTLGTDPSAPRTHWEQLYLPLLQPVVGAPGDRVSIGLVSDTRHGGATVRWSVTHDGAAGSETQRLDLQKGMY